jgi:hypothetical protein
LSGQRRSGLAIRRDRDGLRELGDLIGLPGVLVAVLTGVSVLETLLTT